MSGLSAGRILHLCGEGWVGSSDEAEELTLIRYVPLEVGIQHPLKRTWSVTAAYVTLQFNLFAAVVSQATSEAMMAGRSASKQ